MIEQPDYVYFKCPECEFDNIKRAADSGGQQLCPLCLGDSGHLTTMISRVARSTDRPEGLDARADD